MFLISVDQRTGDVSCLRSNSFAVVAVVDASAVTLEKTGNTGSMNAVVAIASVRPTTAGSINGEWKAPLTGNLIARLAPASLASSMARSTPAISPEITTCSSVLKLAGTTKPAVLLA